MPTPEAIAVPEDGKEAINNFNEWLKTTKDWHKVPGYEDFYYCNDPQTESRLGQLRTNLVCLNFDPLKPADGNALQGHTRRPR